MAKRIPKPTWQKAGRVISKRRGIRDKGAYQAGTARKMMKGRRTTSK